MSISNPGEHQFLKVGKNDCRLVQACKARNGWQAGYKPFIACGNFVRRKNVLPARDRYEPITHQPDSIAIIVCMAFDVHASQIGHKFLVSVLFNIQNDATFFLLHILAKSLRAQEYSQLQRHVKARQMIDRIQLGAAQVVNTITAVLDDSIEFSIRVSPPSSISSAQRTRKPHALIEKTRARK